MPHEIKRTRDAGPTPILWYRSASGVSAQCLFDAPEGATSLAVVREGIATVVDQATIDGRDYVPYSASNNLITHRVVLLPSGVVECEDVAALIRDVRAFIHRYVDVSTDFEEVSAHYALLTWVYDAYAEIPYLRVRGDYGTGKSRFLLTIGSICFTPLFASGASTVSPLFRLLDEIGGTLVIDEADFRSSNERADVVKVLNNGSARGFPVLRSDVTPSKEFRPRAFNVFGPKVIATRYAFEDSALESRCLTEFMKAKAPRGDIPGSLSPAFDTEAVALRNRLLAYRAAHYDVKRDVQPVRDGPLTPRRAQILAALLSVAVEDGAKARMSNFVRHGGTSAPERRADVDKDVLQGLARCLGTGRSVPLSAIIAAMASRSAAGVDPRFVGGVLRRFGFGLHKSNGLYTVPVSEYAFARRVCEAHGVSVTGTEGASEGSADAVPVVPDPSLAEVGKREGAEDPDNEKLSTD